MSDDTLAGKFLHTILRQRWLFIYSALLAFVGQGLHTIPVVVYAYIGWHGVETLHNDLLNLLVAGGIVGVVVYGVIISGVGAVIRQAPAVTVESGFLYALAASALVMSITTGILAVVQVMAVLFISLLGIVVIGRESAL